MKSWGVHSWTKQVWSLPFGSYIPPKHMVLFCWLQARLRPNTAFQVLGVWCSLSLSAVWFSNESKRKSPRGISSSLFNHQLELNWIRVRETDQSCSDVLWFQLLNVLWEASQANVLTQRSLWMSWGEGDRMEGAWISGRVCIEGEGKWKVSPVSLTKPLPSLRSYRD